jgi:hypothetical protein
VLPKQGTSYSHPMKQRWAQNMLNLSDKVKILDLLKGVMSLVEVGDIKVKMSQTPEVLKIKSIK